MSHPYEVSPLPYAYEALNPTIDTETMQLHHDKHHVAYVTNLNNALKDHGQLQGLSLQDLLRRLPELPESIRTVVRNNGGGHANHDMFWQIMGPNAGGDASGKVGEAIARDFGDFASFKTKFNEAGTKQFGSGWVFVTVGEDGKLAIVAKPNQDTPLMEGGKVLFGNDVWEHAYYLTYRNRRADYLSAWWSVVDWGKINTRYDAILGGAQPI